MSSVFYRFRMATLVAVALFLLPAAMHAQSAPDAPVNLQAQIQGGAVQLNWEAPDGFDTGVYRIYRAGQAFADISQALRIAEVNSTEFSFTDVALPGAFDELFYAVTAVFTDESDTEQMSPLSDRASVQAFRITGITVNNGDGARSDFINENTRVILEFNQPIDFAANFLQLISIDAELSGSLSFDLFDFAPNERRVDIQLSGASNLAAGEQVYLIIDNTVNTQSGQQLTFRYGFDLVSQTTSGTGLWREPAFRQAAGGMVRDAVTFVPSPGSAPQLVLASGDANALLQYLPDSETPVHEIATSSPLRSLRSGFYTAGITNRTGVVALDDSGIFTVFEHTGNGNLQPQRTFDPARPLHAFEAIDINRDRQTDLLAIAESRDLIYLFLQNMSAGFTLIDSLQTPDLIEQIRTGDVDRDGFTDFVALFDTGELALFTNSGSGQFLRSTIAAAGLYSIRDVNLVDLNGNGFREILALTDTGYFIFNPVTSTITNVTTGSGYTHLSVADMNANGRPDLLLATDERVEVFLQQSTSGTFALERTYTFPAGVTSMFAAEYSQDGASDLIMVPSDSSGIYYYTSRLPAAEVRVVTENLDYGKIDLTLQRTLDAIVSNYSGRDNLFVVEATMAIGDHFEVLLTPTTSSSGDTFMIEILASLDVDEELNIPVRFTPDNNVVYRDTILVRTNDSSRPIVRIPVEGEGIRVLNQTITGEFTLERDAGPYYLLDAFSPLVTSTGTLRVERGTVILMEENRQLIIDGALEFIDGPDPTARARFTGRTDSTLHNGILLQGSGRIHHLEGFQIDRASGTALQINQSTRTHVRDARIEEAGNGIVFNSGSPSFLHVSESLISDLSGDALQVVADSLTLLSTSFSDVLNGIRVQRLNELRIEQSGMSGTGSMAGGSALLGQRSSAGGTPQNSAFSMVITDSEFGDFDFGINEGSETLQSGDMLVNGNTLFHNIFDTGIRTSGNQDWNIRVQNARLRNSNNGIALTHTGEGTARVLSNTLSNFNGTAVNLALTPTGSTGADDFRVSFNLIEDADVAVQSTVELVSVSNTIRNNRVGYLLDAPANITDTNFSGNPTTIEVLLEDPSVSILAAGNFWGTDDLTAIRNTIIDNNTNSSLAVVEITDIGDDEVVLTAVPEYAAVSQPGGFAQLTWQTLPRATAYQLFVAEGDSTVVIDTDTDFYARLSPSSTSLRLNDSMFSGLADGFYQVGIRAIIESGGEVAVAGPLTVLPIEIDRVAPNIAQAEAYTSGRILTVSFSEVIDTTHIRDLSRWQHSGGISILEVLDNAINEDVLFVGTGGTDIHTYIHTGVDTNTGDARLLLNATRYHGVSDIIAGRGETHIRPAFADLTGNGLTDMLVGTSANLYFFRNTGDSDEFPVWEEDSSNPLIADIRAFIATNELTFISPSLGDITRNGRVDLALGNNSSIVYLFENTGTSAATQQFSSASPFSVTTAAISRGIPVLADGNGNGFLDLYIGGNNGILYYRPSTTQENPTLSNAFVLFSSNIFNIGSEQQLAPALYDLNGNGNMELLLGLPNGTIQVRANAAGTGSSFPESLGPLQASSNTTTFSNISTGSQAIPVIAPVERVDVAENQRRERFKLYTSQVYALGNYDVSISDLKDNVGNLTTLSTTTFTATDTGFEVPDLVVSLVTDQSTDINLSAEIPIAYNLTLTSASEVEIVPQFSLNQGVSWSDITTIDNRPTFTGPLASAAADTLVWDSIADIADESRDDVHIRLIARVIDGSSSIDIIGSPILRQIRVDNFHNHSVADLELLTAQPLMADTLSFRFELEDSSEDILRLEVAYRIGDDGDVRPIATVQQFENLTSGNYSGTIDVLTLPELQGVVGEVWFLFTPFDPHQPGQADSIAVQLDFNEAPEVVLAALADTLSGTALVLYQISDAENDTVSLAVEFALDAETWQPATMLNPELRFGPGQYSDTLRWNTLADLPGYTGAAWLRVTPTDTKAGAPDSLFFQLRNNQAPVLTIAENPLTGFEVQPGIFAGGVSIAYQVLDAENDTVQVAFDYQLPSTDDWRPATVEGQNLLAGTAASVSRSVTWLSATDLPDQNGEVLFRITPSDPFNLGEPDTVSITLSNDLVPTISLDVLTDDTGRLVFADSVRFLYGLENNTGEPLTLTGEYSLDNGNSWIVFADASQFPAVSGDTLISADTLVWNNQASITGLQGGVQVRIVGNSGPLVFQSNTLDSLTIDNRADFVVSRIQRAGTEPVVRDSVITLEFDLQNTDDSPLTVRGFYQITGTDEIVALTPLDPQEAIAPADFLNREFRFSVLPELQSLRDTLDVWLEVTNENGLKFNRSASVLIQVDYNTLPEVTILNELPLVVRDTVAIQYQIVDPDNNMVELQLSYSSDGVVYQPATIVSDTTVFVVGPDGYTGTLLWASHTDLPGVNDELYLLRLLPFDPDQGQAATVQVELRNNIEPSVVLLTDSLSSEIQVDSLFSRTVTIPFLVNDREQDEVALAYAWRADSDEAAWQDATVDGPATLAAADSVLTQVEWDTATDLGPVQGFFWFRVTAADAINEAVTDSMLVGIDNNTLSSISLILPGASEDPDVRSILAGIIPIHVTVSNPTSVELEYVTEYSLDRGDNWVISNRISGPDRVAPFAGVVTDTLEWNTFEKFAIRQDSVLLRTRISSPTIRDTSNVSPFFIIDNTSEFRVVSLELDAVEPVFTDSLIRFRYSLDDPNLAQLQIRGFYSVGADSTQRPAVLIGDTLGIGPDSYLDNVIDFRALPELTSVKDSVFFRLAVSNENGALFNRSEPVAFFVNYNTPPTIEYLAAGDTLVVSDTTAIPFRVTDPDGNAVRVLLEYERDEEWFPATIVHGTNLTPADTTEFEGELLWASYEDIRGVQDTFFPIRLTPVDADTGASVTGVVLIDNNNPPDIRLLPELVSGIEVAPDTLTGNITLPFVVFDPDGDSVRVAFSVRAGNEEAWRPATLATELGAVSAADSTVEFRAIWSSFDDTDTTSVEYWIRAVVSDAFLTGGQDSLLLRIDNAVQPELRRFDVISKARGEVELFWEASQPPLAFELFIFGEQDSVRSFVTPTLELPAADTTLVLTDLEEGIYDMILRARYSPTLVSDSLVQRALVDRTVPEIATVNASDVTRLLTLEFSEPVDTTGLRDRSRYILEPTNILRHAFRADAPRKSLMLGRSGASGLIHYYIDGDQTVWLNTTTYSGFTNATNMKPTFGDLTGNGIYDAVVGMGSDIRVFINEGSNELPVWVQNTELRGEIRSLLPNSFTAVSPQLYPANSDSTVYDLYVAYNGSSLIRLRNTGTNGRAAFTEAVAIQPSLTFEWPHLVAEDMNGNGVKELIIGERNGAIRFYRNTNSYDSPIFATAATLANLGQDQYASPAFLDVNGNGITEMIVGTISGTLRIYTRTSQTSLSFQDTGTLLNFQTGTSQSVISAGSLVRPVVASVEFAGLTEGKEQQQVRFIAQSLFFNNQTYGISVMNLADTLGNVNSRASATFGPRRPGVELPRLTIRGPEVPVGTILADEIPIVYDITEAGNFTVNLDGEYSLDGGLTWQVASLSGAQFSISPDVSPTDTLIWDTRGDFNRFENNVRFRLNGTSPAGPFRSNTLQNLRFDNRDRFQVSEFALVGVDSLNFDERITFSYSLADPDDGILGIRGVYRVGTEGPFQPMPLIGDTTGIGPDDYSDRIIEVDALPLLRSVLDDVTFRLLVTNENTLIFNEGPDLIVPVDYNTPPEVELLVDGDTLRVRDRTEIAFRITDPDGDQVRMIVEFSDDTTSWSPATLTGGSNILDIDAVNYDSLFVWDSYTDLPAVSNETYFLRVQVSDAKFGNTLVVPVNVFNNLPPIIQLLSDEISGDTLSNGLLTDDIILPAIVLDRELDPVTLRFSYRNADSLSWADATVTAPETVRDPDSVRVELVWNSGTDIPDQFGEFWFRVTPSDRLSTGEADSVRVTVDNFGVPLLRELTTYAAITDTVSGVVHIPFGIVDPLQTAFTVQLFYRDTTQVTDWTPATLTHDREFSGNRDADTLFWDTSADFPGEDREGIAFLLVPQRGIFTGIGFENLIPLIKNNQTPEVEILPLAAIERGDISVGFLISDAEGDDVTLQFAYSTDGGDTWLEPTLAEEFSDAISAEVYADTLTAVWQSETDLDDVRTDVLFRIIASDTFEGEGAVTTFLLNNQAGPQIVSFSPSGSQLGTSYSTITLNFNRPMDTSVQDGAVTVCNSSDSCYTFNAQWLDQNQQFRIPLYLDTDNLIRVSVSGDFETGLRDSQGRVLDGNNDGASGGDFSFTFNTTIPGDFNGDGRVDIVDLEAFTSAWRTRQGQSGYQPVFDLHPFVGELPAILPTPNGSIDLDDLIVFARMWQESRARETVDWLAHTGQVDAMNLPSLPLEAIETGSVLQKEHPTEIASESGFPQSLGQQISAYLGGSRALVAELNENGALFAPAFDELRNSLAGLSAYETTASGQGHPVQLLTESVGVFYEDARRASATESFVTYHLTVNSRDTLTAYELFMQYDDAVLELADVQAHPVFDRQGGSTFSLTHTDSAGAFLIVNAANFGARGLLAEGDTLSTIRFRVRDSRRAMVHVGYHLLTPDKDRQQRALYEVEISTEPELPEVFELLQNYPNPFNASTNIRYHLPVDAGVTITIYDVTGRRVTSLLDARQSAGYYSLRYDARFLATGVYFYVIDVRADDGSRFRDMRKMLLLK